MSASLFLYYQIMWKLFIFSVEIFLFIVPLHPVFGISGGHDSNITRHQWLVSLRHNGEHFCGATLLFETSDTLQWALTTAHCASLYSTNLSIRAGSSFRSDGGEIYDVDTIVVHPSYNSETFENNLALMKTKEKVWADYTLGVLLPIVTKPLADMTDITITGWGSTSLNSTYSERLQMVQVPLRTQDHCRSCYSETAITDNMFCAGWTEVGNVTACDGDYGGPGVVIGRLHGIQSWGRSCGVAKYPTVFVKVVNYLDWIQTVTGISPNRY